MVSPTGTPTDYNPSVFHIELKKIIGVCHSHRRPDRRTITRRYFTESWKKITGVCHNHRQNFRGVIDVYYRRTH